jgi:hypothetical protein
MVLRAYGVLAFPYLVAPMRLMLGRALWPRLGIRLP